MLKQTQFASHKQDYEHSATISRVKKNPMINQNSVVWFYPSCVFPMAHLEKHVFWG